jgi:ABC-type antimicrobial peptide transport system permease subunit
MKREQQQEDRSANLSVSSRMPMSAAGPTDMHHIPELMPIPWSVAFSVSWAGLRRRLFRSLITMLGVVLAIALLTYMCVTHDITKALIAANNDRLNVLLAKAGVDIFSPGGMKSMMVLLIILSLITCLVGIINAMLMSVTERIREIGTIKCLGALDSFIVKSFFIESSLQGVIGTLLGMLIGLVVAFIAAFGNYGGYVTSCFPVRAALRSLSLTALVGTLLSVTASIAPAYWAAKKQPVEAMRVEE